MNQDVIKNNISKMLKERRVGIQLTYDFEEIFPETQPEKMIEPNIQLRPEIITATPTSSTIHVVFPQPLQSKTPTPFPTRSPILPKQINQENILLKSWPTETPTTTESLSASASPTHSRSLTPSSTISLSSSPTPSLTASLTPSPTPCPTYTNTLVPTATPSSTKTMTTTKTKSVSFLPTPSTTKSETPSKTVTSTSTPTAYTTQTAYATPTPTQSPSHSASKPLPSLAPINIIVTYHLQKEVECVPVCEV